MSYGDGRCCSSNDYAQALSGFGIMIYVFLTQKDLLPTRQHCHYDIEVFQKICQQHHSPLLFVQPLHNVCDDQGKVTYDYRQYHIELNTAAKYQSENGALAIEILL